MSISGISSGSTVSLITGTTYDSDTSVNDVVAQGASSDSATISKGAQQMNKLKQLQSSDPEAFKEATQKISDELTEKAKSTTDSNEASGLNDMAAKFAEAAKSGTMSSLEFKPPTGANGSSQKTGAFKMGGQGGGGPMAVMDSVVSDVLSNYSTSSTSTSSAVTSVSSTGETAA